MLQSHMFCGSLFVALITFWPGARAQTVDLVIHNGFEDCWSQALTKPAYLTLLQSSLEGQTGCIPQSSGTTTISGFGDVNYTACYTTACPGGNIGCPVTVHSGPFSGDFGSGAFSAPGTADNVSAPVMLSGALSDTCTITASNIALTYSPYFHITPDGNSGDYMAYLTPASAVTITSDNFSGSDFDCTLAASSSVTSQINTDAETVATAQMVSTLDTTAVALSVCPLTP